MTERKISSFRIALAEVKFSEKEASLLKHDIEVVDNILSQWGLMLVGLVLGMGNGGGTIRVKNEKGGSSNKILSAFCSLPGIGWLDNFPLSEVNVYKVSDGSLKSKMVYALAVSGGRARKVVIWSRRKIISYVRETNSIKLVPKNIFDPTARELYELMPKIEKLIKEKTLRERFDTGRTYDMDFSQLIEESNDLNRMKFFERLKLEERVL
jgi:hypothetical protein